MTLSYVIIVYLHLPFQWKSPEEYHARSDHWKVRLAGSNCKINMGSSLEDRLCKSSVITRNCRELCVLLCRPFSSLIIKKSNHVQFCHKTNRVLIVIVLVWN
jgi:hypothetical protein